MSESFDAYYEWLGIAPKDQPPHHYRLLAIDLYEATPNVIDGAVDRQMAHLRTFQTGPRAKYCEELLNKVSAARITLLDPQKKVAYDAQLKEKLDGESGKSKRPIARALPLEEPLATATPLQSPALGAPLVGAVSGPQVRSESSRHRGHRKKGPPWVALGIGGALLAVVAVVAMMAMSGGDEQAARRPKKSVAREMDPPAHKISAGAPAKQDASPTELPTYLRPDKFSETPARVGKRKKPSVNPFDVKFPGQDPPPAAAKRPVADEPPVAARPPIAAKPKRLAIPTDEALKKANAEIRTVFDFKAATNVKAKTKLTQEVLATALESGNDSASRYAMLKMACDMSVHLGDYATAEQVIDEMSQRFDIDTFEMRSKAIVKALTAKVSAEQRAKATRAGLALAKEFHKADRYKEAATIITAVGRAAARLKDTQLVADAKQLAIAGRAMAKQYGTVRRAIETLKTDSDDAAANTSVGKYLCFAKGDWQRGLPMLAKGDDAKLKALAIKELAGVEDAKKQVALGDAWWKIGKAKPNKSYRGILPHAGDWYRKALPQLTGLAKAKVEKRLEAIEESVASNGVPTTVIEEVYLDDVQEESYRTLDGWPLGKHGWLNKREGWRAMLGGVTYKHALSMVPRPNSTSYVIYRLRGGCETFHATAGISNPKPAKLPADRAKTPLVFVVYGDGKILWKSPPIQNPKTSAQCKVNVRGVARLMLEVRCPGPKNGAFAVWFNPRVTVIKKVNAKNSPRDADGARADPKSRPRRPRDAISLGGHWYKLFVGRVTWDDAKQHCEKMGGHLACLETEAEAKAVGRLFARTSGKNLGYICLGGFRDKQGKWQWVNGQPMTYRYFGKGEPNGGTGPEDRLVTWSTGRWNDINGDHEKIRGFVCEWEY